ncbi:MAG TPA: pitrilysin family protein, partial [Blastocatellia bacterium]|nr:pitrilysin family protein [Blastocatellia bacterium]
AETAKQPPGFALSVKRASLLNGLRVMVIERPGESKLVAHLRINAGALFDLAGKGGLADVTAGMLLRGGGRLTAADVAGSVEQLGLSVNVTTGWDSIDFVVSGPVDALETILELLGKLVVTPAFDQKEFDTFKADRISQVKSAPVDDADLVRRKALEAAFGAHPFGRPARGTAESLAQITRADLSYYHGRFFLANNSELIVVGGISAEEVTKLARLRLGPWKKGDIAPASFRPPDTRDSCLILLVDRPQATTAVAAAAQVGVSRRATDYYAAAVMGEILGGLVTKAARQIGSDVNIQSRMEPRFIPGPILVEVRGPTARLVPAIDAIIGAMNHLRGGTLSADELEGAKQRIIQRLSDRLSTPEGTADLLLDIELYGLGRDYLFHFAEWINSIRSEDVRQASLKYLAPQHLSIAAITQAAEVEPQLKRIGTVSAAN